MPLKYFTPTLDKEPKVVKRLPGKILEALNLLDL